MGLRGIDRNEEVVIGVKSEGGGGEQLFFCLSSCKVWVELI